jgi:hypothetical protein
VADFGDIDDVGDVPIDKLAEFAGMVFVGGLTLIGAHDRKNEDRWVQKDAWRYVCSNVDALGDGDYKPAEIARMLRDRYVEAAGVPEHLAPELDGELIVWEYVGRCLFEVLEEGALLPSNTPDGWFELIAKRLEKEGFVCHAS